MDAKGNSVRGKDILEQCSFLKLKARGINDACFLASLARLLTYGGQAIISDASGETIEYSIDDQFEELWNQVLAE